MSDFIVAAFVGRQGQGKTICMLAFAYYFAQATKKPISTNMNGVRGVYTKPLTRFDDLFDRVGHILVLDELHLDFDSRAFAKNAEKTKWASYIRKLRQVVFYNTQQFDKIDKRLRAETSFVIQCTKIKEGYHRLTVYDALNYASNNFIKEKVITLNVSPLYGAYDTHQIVNSLKD